MYNHIQSTCAFNQIMCNKYIPEFFSFFCGEKLYKYGNPSICVGKRIRAMDARIRQRTWTGYMHTKYERLDYFSWWDSPEPQMQVTIRQGQMIREYSQKITIREQWTIKRSDHYASPKYYQDVREACLLADSSPSLLITRWKRTFLPVHSELTTYANCRKPLVAFIYYAVKKSYNSLE